MAVNSYIRRIQGSVIAVWGVFALSFPSAGYAANAVDIHHGFSGSVPIRLQHSYGSVPAIALDTVKEFAPKNMDHLFAWEGDRSTLAGKRLDILFTTVTDPDLKRSVGEGAIAR